MIANRQLVQNRFDVFAHFIKAKCLFLDGNLDSAKPILKTALRSDPDNTDCRELLQQIGDVMKLGEEAKSAMGKCDYSGAIVHLTAVCDDISFSFSIWIYA
jgi:predicted Zn-dependent protease